MRRLISVCHTSVVCAALSFPAALVCSPLALADETDADQPRSILNLSRAPRDLPDSSDAAPAPADELDYHAPGDAFEEAAPAPAAAEDAEAEVFTERYPNGKIKISREVVKDAKKNYINHGLWRMWGPDGSVMAEGEYDMGVRHGVWKQRYEKATLLGELPYNLFTAPFTATVELDHDQIDGKWTIHDAEGRKVSEWEYVDGRRHGKWSWWFPDGNKMQEMNYRQGAIDGKLTQWAADGQVAKTETFENGRKLDRRITHHRGSQQKRSEINYLMAQQVVEQADDWMNAKPARFTKHGEDVRHGRATYWNANGQVEVQGEYRDGLPVGGFTWWHPNGQKSVKGQYIDGQQHGQWTWWHDNGMKAIEGGFSDGAPIGDWAAWKPDGKLAREYRVSEGESLTKTPADDKSFPAPPVPYGASRTSPKSR